MGLIGHDGGGGPARAAGAAGLVAAALALGHRGGGRHAGLAGGRGEPAWSPDGRAIAYFTGPFAGPYTGISVANADGSGARPARVRVVPGRAARRVLGSRRPGRDDAPRVGTSPSRLVAPVVASSPRGGAAGRASAASSPTGWAAPSRAACRCAGTGARGVSSCGPRPSRRMAPACW